MKEQQEIKLRGVFYQALFEYFSDNLPAHLFPEQRIQSVTYDLLDILIDAYESIQSNSKMGGEHLLD